MSDQVIKKSKQEKEENEGKEEKEEKNEEEDFLIEIVTSDDQTMKIKKSYCEKIETIKSCLDDMAPNLPTNPIPIPNVTKPVMEKVLQYCKLCESPKNEKDGLQDKFLEMEQEFLYELILAANILNFEELLDISCRKIADQVRGRTPEEIRDILCIDKEDLSDQEEIPEPDFIK